MMRRIFLPDGMAFEYQVADDDHAERIRLIGAELWEIDRAGHKGGRRRRLQQEIAQRHGVNVRVVKRVRQRLIDQMALTSPAALKARKERIARNPFRRFVTAAGLSQATLIRLTGRSRMQVYRWMTSQGKVPEYAWTIVRQHSHIKTITERLEKAGEKVPPLPPVPPVARQKHTA